MKFLTCFIFSLNLQAQSQVVDSYPLTSGGTAVWYRVTNFNLGTNQVQPHTGTSGLMGISQGPGGQANSELVVTFGQVICEFDTIPTIGNVAITNGDKCSDSNVTSRTLVDTTLGYVGRILESRNYVCTNCMLVSFIGSAQYGLLNTTLIPTGSIVLISSGSCPSGYTEVSTLNGKFPYGTINSNADIGTSGGNNTFTPTGTLTTPIFSGSSNTTSSNGALTLVNLTNLSLLGILGNAAITTINGSNSSVASHTHTVTPTGTISTPIFSGSSADSRPSFIKVIYCSKN